jgi:hypothetical protein
MAQRERTAPLRRRARTWWLLGLAAAFAVVATIAAVLVYRWQMPRVRAEIVRILSGQLGARVELADLQVAFGWRVRVEGRGLVLHHARETPGRPPLVAIERFTITAPALAALASPVHVESVEIERLEIFLPRRDGDAPDAERSREPLDLRGPSPVVIDSIVATGASLALESGTPDRPPKTFAIHRLTLTDAAFDRPVAFDAHLTNPTPAGVIRSNGRFGPWQSDEPVLTPVEGEYRFERADLGTIRGIDGALESTGRFRGPLEQLEVTGVTRTPDFSLDVGGAALPLETTFAAIVDGSNGDTRLHDVRATLGRTPIVARGGVLHTPGRKGRTVSLDVTIESGRLEDVLRLAIDEPTPPMSGRLTLTTALELPPGADRVAKRLGLDGSFTVDDLRFASDAIQDRIDEFSRRGRGRPQEREIRNVTSAMRGRFRLQGGTLRLTDVRFAVRGGLVRLSGRYVLDGGALDFSGTVRLDARASETMTGWKSWVLKPLDPLLAKDGAGTVLPITVRGTAKRPRFGVDVRKVF